MKLLIIFIIIGTLAISSFLYFKSKIPTSSPKAAIPTQTSNVPESTKTYQSKDMKISIRINSNINVEDRLGRIILNNQKGQIIINKTGTNFENIKEYLEDLQLKNHFVLEMKKDLEINSNSAISGYLKDEKFYYIYADYRVYSLSTSSESLYDDLDQIAKSFRYTP